MNLRDRLKVDSDKKTAKESPLFNLRTEVRKQILTVLNLWKSEIVSELYRKFATQQFTSSLVSLVAGKFRQPVDGKDADEKIIVGRVLKLIPRYATLDESVMCAKAEISKLGRIPTEQDIQNIAAKVIETGDSIIKKINEAEEKIDPKKIRGLEDMFKSAPRKGGGGGGMGAIVTFAFTGDGVTTAFTLPNNVAANGLACWAHYNGQWLQPVTHFTISGKTFTTVGFTAENGTTIEGFIIRT